jgi:predicted phosphodiesterase
MRLAVISDIHGNLEALQEVLADVDRCRADAVVCLGDSVGYGPAPEEVVSLIRGREIPCVVGNHKLGLLDCAFLDWFNPPTRRSLVLTRRLISGETLEYMRRLPPALSLEGALCVHGCPPDSATRYLFEVSERRLGDLLSTMGEEICFVGHTHQLEIVAWDGRRVTRKRPAEGLHALWPARRVIVNVGSVGQPRDGSNRAKYVIWDRQERSLDVRFVPYDIAVTAGKILEMGFPEFNASRLW